MLSPRCTPRRLRYFYSSGIAANGYLINQFLDSKTNQRTDRYGGSLENRFRFLKEITEAILTVWPANRVGVRLSPNGHFNDMGAPDFRETFTHAAQQLNGFGLAYLHVMDGRAFGFHEQGKPMTLAEFRAIFAGPLLGNCGYKQRTGPPWTPAIPRRNEVMLRTEAGQ